MSELARGFKCILVCDTNNFVVNLGVEYIRNEAGADTLNLMRAALAGGQYRGGIRLNSYYLDIRVLILQVLAGAGYGAAGAYACNEDVNLVTGLLPDLGTGGCVVRSRVCRVYELTGDEAVRGLLSQLVCLCNRTGHTLRAFGQNQLSAVCLQHVAAFNAHGFRHGEDDAVAAGSCNCCQTDAGVAGGRLDNGCARLECTGLLGLVDHGVCDTILNGTGRIKVLQLCENLCISASLSCKLFSRIQRGVADQVGEALFNIRHGINRLSKLRKIRM